MCLLYHVVGHRLAWGITQIVKKKLNSVCIVLVQCRADLEGEARPRMGEKTTKLESIRERKSYCAVQMNGYIYTVNDLQILVTSPAGTMSDQNEARGLQRQQKSYIKLCCSIPYT